MPARILSSGRISPMTPVDITSASSARAPQASAAQRAICAASRSPWSPVQALATPELIATPRMRSLGVRLAIERHRRREHQILRVHAGAHGRPIGHHQRQIELLRIALDAGVDAAGSKTLGKVGHAERIRGRKGQENRWKHLPYNNAVVSGMPYIRLKFCTAAPEAPLIRLSRR